MAERLTPILFLAVLLLSVFTLTSTASQAKTLAEEVKSLAPTPQEIEELDRQYVGGLNTKVVKWEFKELGGEDLPKNAAAGYLVSIKTVARLQGGEITAPTVSVYLIAFYLMEDSKAYLDEFKGRMAGVGKAELWSPQIREEVKDWGVKVREFQVGTGEVMVEGRSLYEISWLSPWFPHLYSVMFTPKRCLFTAILTVEARGPEGSLPLPEMAKQIAVRIWEKAQGFTCPSLKTATTTTTTTTATTTTTMLPPTLTVKASTTEAKYLAGSKITVKGSLSGKGNPPPNLIGATVKVKLVSPTGKTYHATGKTDQAGRFTITCKVPPAPEGEAGRWTIRVSAETSDGVKASTSLKVEVLPVELKLVSVHVVQVIDRFSCPPGDHKVPASTQTLLVAGRKIGVRVYVSCPSLEGVKDVTPPEVAVQLSITGPSALQQEKIVKVSGAIPSTADFVFTLNPGVYTFWVSVDPHGEYVKPGEKLKAAISNVKVAWIPKTLRVFFVAMDMPNPEKNPQLKRDFQAFCYRQFSFIRQVYPLPPSSLILKYAWAVPPLWVKASRFTLTLWLANKTMHELAEYKGKEPPKVDGKKLVRSIGVLPDRWWGKGEEGVTFCLAERLASLIKYKTPYKSIAAHELGHTFGLYCGPFLEQYQQLPEYGLPVEGLVLKEGKIYDLNSSEERVKAFPHPWAKGQPAAGIYCFMGLASSSNEVWASREAYNELLKRLLDPSTSRGLFVSGIIFKDGRVKLGDWYLVEGEPDPLLKEGGDYTIRCLTPSGETLYSASFGRKGEDTVFAFILPFPEAASKVTIERGGEILVEAEKSPNPPTIAIIHPEKGETLGETCRVEWEASDPDGDKLSYSLLYSNDNGETWTAVAVNLQEQAYTLNLSQLPGGSSCLLRVVATDGFNVGQALSSVFTVEDKPPAACIITPENGETYGEGEEIRLEGFGYDLEDGILEGSSLQWVSSLNGLLGTGSGLTLSNLSPGSHQITLAVRDSTGKTAEDTITVTVERVGKPVKTLVYVKDYGKEGGSLSIPVCVEGADKLGNMDFSLTFNPAVLKATGYRPGSLTASSLLEANIIGNTVKVAFTDPKGINGDGTLIYIDFQVVGKPGETCVLTPNVTVANEFKTHTPLAISTKPGTFTVKGLKGDANGDGRITAVDALMALKMAVSILPPDPACDMNGDGRVTSLDATLIREEALKL